MLINTNTNTKIKSPYVKCLCGHNQVVHANKSSYCAKCTCVHFDIDDL